jgi:hypothetical protein
LAGPGVYGLVSEPAILLLSGLKIKYYLKSIGYGFGTAVALIIQHSKPAKFFFAGRITRVRICSKYGAWWCREHGMKTERLLP